MPTYWNAIQKIKRVEAMANKMGFEFSAGRDLYIDSGDSIHLIPLGDALPHYSRGAEIFSGSVEDIGTWLEGLQWARNYDEMLKLGNEKKRSEREQVERNRQLLQMVKTGKKVEGKIGLDIIPYEFDGRVTAQEYEDDIPF